MKLRIEHKGRTVLEIDFDDLTEEEQGLIVSLGKRKLPLVAKSAECNADFVAYWSHNIAGLYRRREA